MGRAGRIPSEAVEDSLLGDKVRRPTRPPALGESNPFACANLAVRYCPVVGCVIGEDYPEPIVDHAEARVAALDAFKKI